jgi:hypothetical protein
VRTVIEAMSVADRPPGQLPAKAAPASAFWSQPWPRIPRPFTRVWLRAAAGQSARAVPYLAAPFSLTTPSGMAALNAAVTRQAAMGTAPHVDPHDLAGCIGARCPGSRTLGSSQTR